MMMREVLSRTTSLGRAAAARRFASLLLWSLAFAHVSGLTAAAAPLADYRARVRQAIKVVDAMVYSADEEAEGEEADEAAPYFAASIAEVRRLLPPNEQVEGAGTTTVVNNAWLHSLLDDYQKKAGGISAAERAASLSLIADRLNALEARLAETEAASQAAPTARDKDAEKGKLATILRGKEYNREAAEGGALQRLLEQIADAISSLFPNVKPLRPAGAGRPSLVLQVVVFALALAVIFYIVWKFWVRRRDRIKPVAPKAARVVLGERIEADQTASDLLTEAELLAREGDLRGAIRKAYVALLCELGDRKIIRLAQHKTNRDYLRDARRDATPQLYEEMRPLTNNFERHWYGLEEADQSDWADFRTRCRQALNKV